jgi:ATP-dependent DNA helicase RecG
MLMLMKMKKLQELLNEGEGIAVEFKQSRDKLNRDVFESVCAFLNRNGGHLFLGVDDDGNVIGVNEDAIEKVKKEFVTSMNNPQKISPTFYLSIEEIEVDGKKILYIFVPESSQVHRCKGKIFDRNEDGDLDITDNTNQVSAMYKG